MNEKEKVLTASEAYMAMYKFLEKEYEQTRSDDIAILLGSMSILQDGSTADSAVIDSWSEAIASSLNNSVDTKLRLSRTS